MNTEQKLNILYDLLVDNYDILATELTDLIKQPLKITDTNKFASLLEMTKDSNFIDPLLFQISLGNKGDAWLTDFLYAAISLLEDDSWNEFNTPTNLIDKLEDWILNNKGEIAWKAANLLKFYESESAEKIQLKKLEERGDFFLTYVECILGLLRYNRDKHIGLVAQIADDETRDEKLREFCADIEP
ncbi:hypothetical protein [Mucilaginibacter sp. UR6-11]|uniref:hypothetical protein n=1 Tax=Mucilaginibacter sp. UR6-11 TaxID=1435644 RepID=UPI001E503E64|nr:hypothetical protein [Mucilaginibacter sp. UR6-11]MCC8426163.1 hypothetical protein [Mucilaginibacter sp. UR6-11]